MFAAGAFDGMEMDIGFAEGAGDFEMLPREVFERVLWYSCAYGRLMATCSTLYQCMTDDDSTMALHCLWPYISTAPAPTAKGLQWHRHALGSKSFLTLVRQALVDNDNTPYSSTVLTDIGADRLYASTAACFVKCYIGDHARTLGGANVPMDGTHYEPLGDVREMQFAQLPLALVQPSTVLSSRHSLNLSTAEFASMLVKAASALKPPLMPSLYATLGLDWKDPTVRTYHVCHIACATYGRALKWRMDTIELNLLALLQHEDVIRHVHDLGLCGGIGTRSAPYARAFSHVHLCPALASTFVRSHNPNKIALWPHRDTAFNDPTYVRVLLRVAGDQGHVLDKIIEFTDPQGQSAHAHKLAAGIKKRQGRLREWANTE
jgi:hypothetical protein